MMSEMSIQYYGSELSQWFKKSSHKPQNTKNKYRALCRFLNQCKTRTLIKTALGSNAFWTQLSLWDSGLSYPVLSGVSIYFAIGYRCVTLYVFCYVVVAGFSGQFRWCLSFLQWTLTKHLRTNLGILTNVDLLRSTPAFQIYCKNHKLLFCCSELYGVLIPQRPFNGYQRYVGKCKFNRDWESGEIL